MLSWKIEKLVDKMMSIKFVIFLIATFMKGFGLIGNAEWLTVTMAVIAGRELQKGFNKHCCTRITKDEIAKEEPVKEEIAKD